MKPIISLKTFFSDDIGPLIQSLAKLRMTVFRDYPYLYEGSLDYEENYLKIYTQSSQSVLVAAFVNNELIGAATAMPLKDEADYVKEPFLKAHFDIESLYYFAESVLLKDYRGHGIGHQFFNEREAAALKFNYHTTTFCGVKRPEDHPLRPKDYRPLDDFWQKRGYEKQTHLVSSFSWRDIGDTEESEKEMTYWMKKWK